MHPIRRVVTVISVVAALTMLIASSTLAANGRSDRPKDVQFFQGQKTCAPIAPGIPNCTMTTSNVPLLAGADIAYTSRPAIVGEPSPGRIESDILLTTVAAVGTRQSTANGHCTFYFATSTGLCVYSGGTRQLAGFRAQLVIGPTAVPNVFSAIGKYWFGDKERD